MADPGAGAEAGDLLTGGGCADWREAAARAEAIGSPLLGLPQGIRIRRPGKSAEFEPDEEEKKRSHSTAPGLLRQDAVILTLFCLAGLLVTGFAWVRRSEGAAELAEHPKCKQCQPGWWETFWHWRLEGIANRGPSAHSQAPPEGMEWEWDHNGSDTDWFGVSPEFVEKVVSEWADPKQGPILHVGCGDSPMPGLLYKAGFHEAEHIDIAPQVIEAMQKKYPEATWPGMHFAVRDFLEPGANGGPPPPLNRFAAVIDKAGIWDWLQDEAMQYVPLLLAKVRSALLLEETRKGVYIIVTKQNPAQLSDTLARIRAPFSVETSRALGTSNIAWSYVLEPL